MKRIKVYFLVFLNSIRKYKLLYCIYTLLVLFISSKEIFLILTIDEILKALQDNNFFNNKVIIFVGLFGISYMLNFLNNIIYNKLDQKIESSIWLSMNKKLSQIRWIDYEDKTIYNLIEHVTNNSNQSYRNIVFGIPEYLSMIMKIIFYMYIASILGIYFVLILFVLVLLGLVLKFKQGNSTEKVYDALIPVRKYSKYLTMFPTEISRNADFKVKRMNKKFEEKINKSFESQALLESQIIFREKGFNILINIYWCIVFIVIVIFVLNQSRNNDLLNIFIASILSFYFLFQSLENLGMNINNDITNLIDVQKYQKFLNIENERILNRLESKIDNIILEGVRFTYPDSLHPSLIDINLNVQSGEKIMIVGLNGSGKSTLCSILSGINNNFSGKMLFNSGLIDSKSVEFCSKVSFLIQEFGQYNLNVRENVLFGQKVDRDEYNKILDSLDLTQSIGEIGDDVMLGTLDEGGRNLSKGQWQKLAIARLIAKNKADIFILDEPTSYLDPIAEIDFYATINKFAKDKIVFFVSHRLGYAKFTDKIIFMDNGRICSFDTHENLMKDNDKYKKMYNEQKKWYE